MVPDDVLALRPRQAAKALNVSVRTLWALSAPRGPIPCIRIGHGKRQTVLSPRAVLEQWLAQQAQPARPAQGAKPAQEPAP